MTSDSASQALQLAEMHLVQYVYEDEVDDDGLLTIDAKVLLSRAEHEQFLDLAKRNYFPVLRVGVDPEPRDMRFGGYGWWSEHGDSVKTALFLVERRYDEENPPESSDWAWAQGHVQLMLAQTLSDTSGLLDALLDKLRDKALLTEEDVEDVRASGQIRSPKKRLELRRLEDIDRP